jgi:hypothetical protein
VLCSGPVSWLLGWLTSRVVALDDALADTVPARYATRTDTWTVPG